MSRIKRTNIAVLGALLLLLSACATYVTPGGSVELSKLADADVNELLARKPAATFPAHVAVARIQAPQYQTYRTQSYGSGRYSVVTTREVEKEENWNRLKSAPGVAGVGWMNRLLLPTQLDSLRDLRTAAARLKADILLVYTLDTSFHVGGQKYGPLNAIALGLLPNKEVRVTTTASAAFFDVRTEFLYGVAEATAQESKHASMWGSSGAVDDLRVVTETKAFQALVPEMEKTLSGIAARYSSAAAVPQ